MSKTEYYTTEPQAFDCLIVPVKQLNGQQVFFCDIQ